MDPNAKVSLVTGSGRRIGRALALALGDAGCRVAVHYNQSEQDANETASLIKAMGSEAITFKADLEDPTQVEDLATQVRDQLGPIEIIINNASVFDGSETETPLITIKRSSELLISDFVALSFLLLFCAIVTKGTRATKKTVINFFIVFIFCFNNVANVN